MTQFGYSSSFASPAAKRIIASAYRHTVPPAVVEARREDTECGLEAFEALRLTRASSVAQEGVRREAERHRHAIWQRRMRLCDRFEEAFRTTKKPRTLQAMTMAQIVRQTAEKYRIPVSHLNSRMRTKNIVHPRQEAMWRCRNELHRSFPAIGRFFGFDHTSVLWGVKQHEARLLAIELAA